MGTSVISRIPVVDADTHVVEPPDLWTSRMSARHGDLVPHVRWDDKADEEAWFIGDDRVTAVAGAAQAGWSEYPPDHPRRWSDADPATWEPPAVDRRPHVVAPAAVEARGPETEPAAQTAGA